MATEAKKNPTTLELTEVETKLRQLLLDVAAYIEDTTESTSADSAVTVPEDLAKEKVILRFTGGWVRDKLLGVGSHDIDVAINKMTGEHFGLKMIEYLELPGNAEKHGLAAKSDEKVKAGSEGKSRKIAPGLHKIEANPEKSKNLETATTKIMGVDLDLVNLRKETYNEISRNPEIEFGTPQEDAMRRDATVNAMFYNLNTLQIEDFTGRGFEDMESKIIRTPLEPYQTFKDDPLRILRLIRFASRLNYSIDAETEKAMGNKEIGEVLKVKISRERVGIELEKMLKGPDPLMALSLIDRLGLYGTIFTDPTRTLPSPDTDYFAPAYRFTNELLRENSSAIPPVIAQTLMPTSEEHYLAWVCAALMPWADAPTVPHQKPTQRPYYAAHLVAREGFKAPNKVCDVVSAAAQNGEEIRNLVDGCYTQSRQGNTAKTGRDFLARDTLGMAIRKFGASWRTQVFFSMAYEVALGSVSRDRIFQSYSTFLAQLNTLSLLEAHTFKPLITGSQLAKELGAKPGPWMKDALDVVMAWQLRNPNVKDASEAIEAVRNSQHDKTPSELPSCLASHFLRLTIRPLFSQSKMPDLTPAGHKAPSTDVRMGRQDSDSEPRTWQDPKNGFVIDLLRWSVSVQGRQTVEANWALLIPPILRMIDDVDLRWKATGCSILALLLERTSPVLLSRTGLDKVFIDTLFPLFTYLPTLTEESESILLLNEVFPVLLALLDVMHPVSATSDRSGALSTPRERYLDRLVRDGVLAPLFHARPSTYPKLGTALLSPLPRIFKLMGIDSVKHLQSLTQLLANILAEPFGLAYPPLFQTATQALQSLVLNAWPRVAGHRGEIMRGVCICWLSCMEEETGSEDVSNVKEGLRELVEMMDNVFESDNEIKDVWAQEKKDMVGADWRLEGLLRE